MIRKLIVSAVLALTVSCGGTTYFLSEEEFARFEAAGPILPEIDTDRILSGLTHSSPYRVVSGDLLEIKGPRALIMPPEDQRLTVLPQRSHFARVDAKGSIYMPVIGEQKVKGRSLIEIEDAIASAAHPKFLKERPSIVVQVVSYQTVPVTVVGAVEKPGIVHLRSDERSLYGALSATGGILRPSATGSVGAKMIRIRWAGGEQTKPLVLPVKGLNVPLGNVALKGGETIEVQRYEPVMFTVVGLVMKPGAYRYGPEATINLMQALAIAGGVDMFADPPYATVFRKDASGKIIPATFGISGVGLVASSTLEIKPGDVIVVEQTAASWTRTLLAKILRFQVGFFITENTFD